MKKTAVISRIKADGRTTKTWAILRGHKPPTVYAILTGVIPPTSYAYKAIMSDLKADGYATDEDI